MLIVASIRLSTVEGNNEKKGGDFAYLGKMGQWLDKFHYI